MAEDGTTTNNTRLAECVAVMTPGYCGTMFTAVGTLRTCAVSFIINTKLSLHVIVHLQQIVTARRHCKKIQERRGKGDT